MFGEGRATGGCGADNVFLAPSSEFFLDSPELYEKSCTSDPLLRSLVQADHFDSVMPAGYRATSGLDPREEDESSEVCGGLVPVGDEDLEALMCYIDGDDHLGSTPVAVINNDVSPYDGSSSQRKRSFEEGEDEEEVESQLYKRQKFQPEADKFHEQLSSPDVSINGTGSGVTQPPLGDYHTSGDEFYPENSADELQILCDDFGFEMPEWQCSSCSPDGGAGSISSGSARHSRRQKIKETVKMLREAIPGGECMDTAIVLDEAISYVKLLQLQVQALGAQRLAQRAGR